VRIIERLGVPNSAIFAMEKKGRTAVIGGLDSSHAAIGGLDSSQVLLGRSGNDLGRLARSYGDVSIGSPGEVALRHVIFF
jgi:hypothetical protein